MISLPLQLSSDWESMLEAELAGSTTGTGIVQEQASNSGETADAARAASISYAMQVLTPLLQHAATCHHTRVCALRLASICPGAECNLV
jgi:hypothetical protein